ncbi:hypothetical protein TNIN_301051 [Trichonephila inaurata madagascariensis]|uniref:Uncharacterized protein n=1 Tax=Trichonephila inaurata madagascariensis TaxID=2747483 RepID=A0A8X6WTC8_9ARAC|nr:hypothetical protein TNIN_301051 [Trichonephila inaurata madagascariensis]
MKRLQRSPVSSHSLCMIHKFETTERKHSSRSSGLSMDGSLCVPVFSCVRDMPYSTVRPILCSILIFFIHTKSTVHLLKEGDPEFQKVLYFSSLFEWGLTSFGNGTFYGVKKPAFASMDKLSPSIGELMLLKILAS